MVVFKMIKLILVVYSGMITVTVWNVVRVISRKVQDVPHVLKTALIVSVQTLTNVLHVMKVSYCKELKVVCGMRTMYLTHVASGMIGVTVWYVVRVITWKLNHVTHVLMVALIVSVKTLTNANSVMKV